jgi:hypothetical protein
MLVNGPLLIILFAVFIALKYKGRWYKESLLFSVLAIVALIYMRTIHVSTAPSAQCFSNIQACSQNQAASTADIIRVFLLALLLSSIALLLSYKKSKSSTVRPSDSSRKILIPISLIVLVLTFLFIVFLFYALSKI